MSENRKVEVSVNWVLMFALGLIAGSLVSIAMTLNDIAKTLS